MFLGPIFKSTFDNFFSCEFDGIAEYINCGDIANFERNESFSFAFWMKTVASGGAMIARRAGTPAFKGWEINNTNGQIGFNLSSNNVTANRIVVRTTAATYDDGNWHHIVCTYDGSSSAGGVNIYVAGVIVGMTTVNDTLTADIANIATCTIGARESGSGNFWNGKLDEPVIYNKELSNTEVSEIYGAGVPRNLSALTTENDLYGWWRFTQFDKDNFPTITDHSGNARDGTAVNMVTGNIQGDTP